VSGPLVIAHVVAPAAVGGLERVVCALAQGHAARGHAVHVLSVFDRGGSVTPLPLDGTPGVTQHVLEVARRRYDRERADVAALCRRLGVQVLHTHGYRPDVVDAPVARALGIPAVTTVHGFTGGGWKNRLFERLQVRAYRHFDGVVAVSRLLQAQLAARGVPAGRLHCIPNAWAGSRVPLLDRGAARRALGAPGSGPCIGWVGRLSGEKGPDVLLDALALVTDLPWRAAIIGTGREAAALRRRADALGLAERVVWCGDVADAARCYPAFDVFVLSSRTEGTPIVLFEAMAAVVPVVATRVGGIPDVVDEAQALLVPPEDPRALGAALRAALADPAAAALRAAAAQQRLARDFAAGPWLDRYEMLYRMPMGGSRHA